MPDNNCILGLAAGYHYGDVRPFLLSLDRVGYTGRRVLFVSETTRDLERMAEHDVTIILLKRSEELAHVPYNALRYFLYLDFLKQYVEPFERILISDVRDVVFQRDPFGFSWLDGINCTLEDRRVSIGQCPHNAHWIRGHQGESALESVAEKTISCSGTTVGDHKGMMQYLTALTSRLIPYIEGERMAGYDQGVHNVMVHTDVLENITLHDNHGPIITLGYTKGEPALDDEGFVLNEAGERAHIVHQYDRKPNLFKAIRARFA